MLRFWNAAKLSLMVSVIISGQLFSADTDVPADNPLEQRVTLHFDSVPLPDAAAAIAEKFGLNLVIDVKGVTAAGKSPEETRLVINVVNVPLDDALEAMLKPHRLSHVLDDEVVRISGLDSSAYYTARAYSVPDLVASRDGDQGQPVIDRDALQQLANFLKSVVAPDSWRSDREFPPSGFGSVTVNDKTCSLVIRQTPEVHDQVRDVLDQMRRVGDLQVVADVRIIAVGAHELLSKRVLLQQPQLLSAAEQSAWRNGTHPFSDSTVLAMANMTVFDGATFKLPDAPGGINLTVKATSSFDRRNVIISIGNPSAGSVAQLPGTQTGDVPDGKTLMVPLRKGRLPLVDDQGFAYVVVVTPTIKVIEEEEELLGALPE